MSVFTNATVAGIPSNGNVKMEDLFTRSGMIARCNRMIGGTAEGEAMNALSSRIKISKYKVEMFDLSDEAQRSEYEKLWMELFEMVSNGEAFVDSRKDLVHRADGTSYWLRSVEYAIFKPIDNSKKGGDNV